MRILQNRPLSQVPGDDGTTYKKTVWTTDAWKFYAGSSGKGKDQDYFMHHIALLEMIKAYNEERVKEKKDPIKKIIIWTDGCPNQYMCCQNFVKVAGFWAVHGIELVHRFAPTSDFKGVHDTVGKEDRRWINKQVMRDNISVPQPADLYLAVKKGRPTPAKDWNRDARSLAKKRRLAIDRYRYRFISWTDELPKNLKDDDGVIIADRAMKWGASPVERRKSLRDYRCGSPLYHDDLRARGHPCSEKCCRNRDWTSCPFKKRAAADCDFADGWKRFSVILQERAGAGTDRASRSAQRRVFDEDLEQKQRRLEMLAPDIKKGSIVAFGVAESERIAQGVEFYLGKVKQAPQKATEETRVGSGRDGWNVKSGEYYLKVDWFLEIAENVFVDEKRQDTQLLEMVVHLDEGRTGQLRLEPISTTTTKRGRGRRNAMRQQHFRLHDKDLAAVLDANLYRYVDRAAAPGSSA